MAKSQELLCVLENKLGNTRVKLEWLAEHPYGEQAEPPDIQTPYPPCEPATPEKRVNPTQQKGTPGEKRVLLGRYIATTARKRIRDLAPGNNKLIIEGNVVAVNERNGFKNKRRRGATSFPLDVSVTDGTDSIYCSMLLDSEEERSDLVAQLNKVKKSGDRVAVQGVCRLSRIVGELTFYANDVCVVPGVLRQDNCELKRVELHLHTRMSSQDGITDVNKAFETAKRFGHKALAITDHGVVQAFPAEAKAAAKTGVKPLFGVEGYLHRESELIDMDQTYVVFDLETTGLKPERCEIIEVGAVKLINGEVVDRFQTFVNDGGIVPPNITQLTGITTAMLDGAPSSREVLGRFHEFCKGCCLVAHNAEFDMGFVRFHSDRFGLKFENKYADTLMLSRYLMHDLENHKLDTLCEELGVVLKDHHRASDDAEATGGVFLKLLDMLKALDLEKLPVRSDAVRPTGAKKRANTNHIIILAQTQDGMKNLYRIVSYAHLDHFYYHPVIPFSLLSIYREGLILGTACEQGELYQAILKNKSEREIDNIAEFYDFLEIQPRANNAFMVREGIASDERILEIPTEIVALGDNLN
jgi:DNA polymerase-3 subunit alpha (Gram-positive type)